MDALVWVAQTAQNSPQGPQALALLLGDHIKSPKIASLCQVLAYSRSPSAEKDLRLIIEKNPSREVQGQATFSLAQLFMQKGQWASDVKPDDRAKANEEAEKLFEKVKSHYADLKDWRGTLGAAAQRELFEIRHLSLGMTAPDIQGQDIDTKTLKLSDYRGKVVLLDFWGNW